MSNELMTIGGEMFMPIMDMGIAKQRREYLVKFIGSMLKPDHDYGKVPGTQKDTLLKPGAEKLATFFGLTPIFILSDHVEDWDGAGHNGEPLFYYRYKCELWRQGVLISTSEGSCNSRESKYRYRKNERTCPQCGQAAIKRSADEYGGGWYCNKKSGGCGAKYSKGNQEIESQEVGRIANPDISDQVNTIQKMAQKRALIASVLLAVNASEFFTQDIEDLVDTEYAVIDAQPTSPQPQAKRQAQTPAITSNGQCNHCHAPNGKPHARGCPAFTETAQAQPTNGHANGATKPAAPAPVITKEEIVATDAITLENVPEMSQDGNDNPFAPDAAQAQRIASGFAQPPAAQAWAVSEGYCENEFAARNSFVKVVTEKFNGKLTQSNMKAAILAFVEHQLAKASAAQAA